MKKILILTTVVIIVVLLILLIGAGIYFFYYYQNPDKENDSEDQKELGFSIIETDPIPYDQEYRFNIGKAEFIIYPPDLETFEFGYFEAYNKGEKVYSTEPLYMIMDLLAFQYDSNKYIILGEYSGGAHCCFQNYIFLLDENDDLELIAILDLGEATILEDNIFIKDEDLYIKIFDDRFAYFYTPYVTSYLFAQYLKVEGDKLIESNKDFQKDYLKEAVKCENDLEKELTQGSEEFDSYAPLLTCIAINYLLADQEQEAWQKFEEYSVQVPLSYYGTSINLESFKQEIIGLYQSESIPFRR